ncbi:hypothetical protein NEOLI_004403 [Neolecta irregularis DAH-3]|uniref:Uncharacterized protein n=1 Tax=Neolecta irregularis (strain DAH-3) TaxID=1198029 RepID=A0A1U7LII2_NEOID|nr:hypothetical protein NEOLI_004403 [Neolecta irregularis DAH-3]|eukprot:OLL22341.1 hypothetical protein NEOLI_004403 [Neolecta irregularis DAH-3]
MLNTHCSSPLRATSPNLQSSPPSSPLSSKFNQRRASFKKGGDASPWRDRQRCLFLDKVRSGRDRRFLHGRGGEDEMMRIMYASEKKRAERAMEREAQNIDSAEPDEMDAEFLEELQKQEEKELEACLSHFYSEHENQTTQDAEMSTSQPKRSNIPQTCQNCNINNLEQVEGGIVCFTCGWSCTL